MLYMVKKNFAGYSPLGSAVIGELYEETPFVPHFNDIVAEMQVGSGVDFMEQFTDNVGKVMNLEALSAAF